MTRHILIALMWVACTGCYREPSNPAHQRQNAESRGSSVEPSVEPVAPSDGIHAGPADAADAIVASHEVEVGTYCLTAPDQWVRKKLSSPFLLAEFALPKAEGDTDDGRLTVSTAGGTVESNLARWKGQFGGTPESESQEIIEVDGVKITFVDYAGTFAGQGGPMVPAPPKAGYRMLGAIIPLDDQLYFIKGYGPHQTVAAHAERIRAFIESLQPKAATQSKPAGDTR